MFKTQYYKNQLFLAFSRQKSSLPWQPTKILIGSSSYFDEYLKGYLCVKFGAFAKKLTIFSQICWTNSASVSKAMVSIPNTKNSIKKAAILDFKMAAMWNYVFPHNFSSK